eukprot:CAMPEP_0116127870 /NCGR_PEP_ID=MMETSP0329-20121206/7062_1 /TAXON_ID=697910 /ORGANISM="Pseudo-nitzschia arenysensis, Strain B593" /LENGTH=625 /DNA_ID=CAMNT_0003621981 /DNA_START=140 /DNA_END=2017 /DNA_ORIENTATION=-
MSNNTGMKHTTVLLLVLGVFGVTLVMTNIFFLPSIGFLNNKASSQYKLALDEFIGQGFDNQRVDHVEKKNYDQTGATSTTSSSSSSSSLRKQKQQEPKTEDSTSSSKPENNNIKQVETKPETENDGSTPPPKIAGLNCDRFGGPSEEIAAEMVYWRDIPKDAAFVSPFKKTNGEKQYLTFEPDEGGFNNIRMSMETATALAHAMGRILVLPPEQNMYLLGKDILKENNRFTFHKFFPFDAISKEHDAVEVISMEEFLETEVMKGNLKDKNGKTAFPPHNETTWEGSIHQGKKYWHWFRSVTTASKWDFSQCVVAFPEKPGAEAVQGMQEIYDKMDTKKQNHDVWKEYYGKPRKVDSPPDERLHEMLSFRKKICMYNETLQDAKVMHFMGDNHSGARLLVHFYAFLFFQDWKQDLWTKRYVRDHLRYIDAIQCGAASIVHAVRQKAIENGNPDGHYDSMHIRRGDFQYKQTRIPAEETYKNIADKFTENSTVFIATDERDKKFFDPLRKHYNIYFLDDFVHLLPDGFNKNYFGMLDQRVASRGRIFFGAYYSTFTGYINRMRGYHSQKEESEGYLDGKLESYFYVPRDFRDTISVYSSLRGPLWGREFPTAWRQIDYDLHESHIVA